jgi:DNA ligase D-like protein (predicted polymerase)
MWSDRKGEDIHFCRLENAASLLWSLNHGNLEMHPLLSIAPEFDTPTAMVFDLDPGEGAGILDAAEAALVLHDMLRGVGLESLVKTTGSNGVHVYVPLNTPATFEQTKAFSRDVAEVMAGRTSDRVVARVDKRLRCGRVFVDWGQNDRHKSTAAAYSLRVKRARPTVSLRPWRSKATDLTCRRRPRTQLRPVAQVRLSATESRAVRSICPSHGLGLRRRRPAQARSCWCLVRSMPRTRLRIPPRA